MQDRVVLGKIVLDIKDYIEIKVRTQIILNTDKHS
jgi:hypothetical protein